MWKIQKQLSRSIPSEVPLGKGVLKICRKFQGEHPCWSVISIKLNCNFIEITLQRGRSPKNLLPIFRTPFPKGTSEGMLLKIQSRLVVKLKLIQLLSACKNDSINLLDSSNYLWDTPDLRVPWSKRSPPFLSIPTQWFVSACKKPAHFINSFMKYI